MSEDPTKILQNSPLLMRIQETLDRLETHIKFVEEKIDRQGYDTRPMWEKVQAIVEKTQLDVEEINRNLSKLSRRVEVFNEDIVNARMVNKEQDERLARLESEEGGLTTIN